MSRRVASDAYWREPISSLYQLPAISWTLAGVLGHWSLVRIVPGASGVMYVFAPWSLKCSTRFSMYDCCNSVTMCLLKSRFTFSPRVQRSSPSPDIPYFQRNISATRSSYSRDPRPVSSSTQNAHTAQSPFFRVPILNTALSL